MKAVTIKACIFILFFLALERGFALDISFRVRPYLSVPSADASSLFDPGGGADFISDIDISSLITLPLGLSLSPEAGINLAPLKSVGETMQIYSGGLGVSAFFYPASRLNLRFGTALGFYEARYSQETTASSWWKLGAEAGFRFSPSFILSAAAGYRNYNYTPGTNLYTGFFAGLSIQFLVETGASANNIGVELVQQEPVFPVFLGLYRQNQIGSLKITNNESAEIRNVTVSFRAAGYTSSLLLCATIPVLDKREEAAVPLYADFSSTLFNFSEDGRIPGELIIRSEILGEERTTTQSVILGVANRNSFRWDDPGALAVFVSSTAPEVLDFSKYIVGIARNHLRPGLNQKMQYAMYLFEGMRTAGIRESGDRLTPYGEYHRKPGAVDYLQFPFQTLAYRSGDIDDLGLLYAALLESVDIKTVLIPLRADFVVAFSLGIQESAAANFFYSLDNILVLEGEVWLPLSLGSLREGFVNSWRQGIQTLNEAFSEETPPIVLLRTAWASYPPAAIQAQEAQAAKPLEANVVRAVETGILRYISSEFGPKILEVRETIRREGGSAALYNRLGLLYVRSGMYAEAKDEYRRAADLGLASAMVNLGNIFYLEKNSREAEMWYRQALRRDPQNKAAADGLNRIAVDRLE
jgi:hypothetical protein